MFAERPILEVSNSLRGLFQSNLLYFSNAKYLCSKGDQTILLTFLYRKPYLCPQVMEIESTV